jgi:tetratricopeptide (TPR) repeat protein
MYTEALNTLKRAETILRREPALRHDMAQILINIGNIYQVIGSVDEAISTLQEALAISEEFWDKLSEGECHIALGAACYSKKDANQALSHLQKAVQLYETTENSYGKANALLKLGEVKILQQDYSLAEEYFLKSHDIYEAFGLARGIAQSNLKLGTVYVLKGHLENALATFKKALAIFEELNDKVGEADALYAMAETLKGMLLEKEALAAYQRALEIYEKYVQNAPRITELRLRIDTLLSSIRQNKEEAVTQNTSSLSNVIEELRHKIKKFVSTYNEFLNGKRTPEELWSGPGALFDVLRLIKFHSKELSLDYIQSNILANLWDKIPLLLKEMKISEISTSVVKDMRVKAELANLFGQAASLLEDILKHKVLG